MRTLFLIHLVVPIISLVILLCLILAKVVPAWAGLLIPLFINIASNSYTRQLLNQPNVQDKMEDT
jgi:hypothetical protein